MTEECDNNIPVENEVKKGLKCTTNFLTKFKKSEKTKSQKDKSIVKCSLDNLPKYERLSSKSKSKTKNSVLNFSNILKRLMEPRKTKLRSLQTSNKNEDDFKQTKKDNVRSILNESDIKIIPSKTKQNKYERASVEKYQNSSFSFKTRRSVAEVNSSNFFLIKKDTKNIKDWNPQRKSKSIFLI